MNDLRFAFRQLRKSPGFTAMAVLTLALGIGVNTSIFSVFKAVLLEPFPYPEAGRLVHIWHTAEGQRWRNPLNAPEYFDLRDRSRAFAEMGVYCPYSFNLGGTEPVRVSGILCSASVLRVLGVPPAMGRWFSEEEESNGSRPIVLSHQAWQEHFAGAEDIVGRSIRVDGESRRVVGVMPSEFEFLCPWFQGQTYALWTPFPLQGDPGQLGRDDRLRDARWLLAIGRLKPGVSYEAAEADLRSIHAQLAEDYPKTNGQTTVWVAPLVLATLEGSVGKLLVLMVTVGFVLVVACANVASLTLAQGAGRLTEVAVRVVMGASRRRIVRQMFTESLVLAVAGGVVGLLMAQAGLGTLRGVLPAGLPRVQGIEMDLGVLAFTMGLSLITTLLFGLAPALVAARTRVNDVLKEGNSCHSTDRIGAGLLRKLTVVQVAIALLVTNEALLLFKGLRNVLETPHVFDTGQVLTASIHLAGEPYASPPRRVLFWEQLVQRLETHPQVERAAAATQIPLRSGGSRGFRLDREPPGSMAGGRLAAGTFVSPGYFQAMGITLLAGRTLQAGDERLPEQKVVVNRALAERCWPGQEALGRRIHDDTTRSAWSAVVVGVVESTRQRYPGQTPDPEIYWHYAANPWEGSYLVVRSVGDPRKLVTTIRSAVSGVDSSLPVTEVLTMDEVLEDATRGRRLLLVLIASFAGLTLTLAMTGIYGMVSYQVNRRTRELGIRMALGAGREQIFRLVFEQTLGLLVVGLGIGLTLALGLAFITRSQLYLTHALQILHVGGGVGIVLGAALLATLVPAWRATRVDPVQTLRSE